MARNVRQIADRLGAEVISRVPDTGGGAFGAARLARVVRGLQTRLVPGQGKRPGRPSEPEWELRPKVPMSRATERRLIRLAEEASSDRRKVSPMQVAAQILEDALSGSPDR